METDPANVSLIKKPSALVPLAMSLAALALVVGHAAVYGIVHEADEGAAAHIFQLLMVAQLPFVAYFMIRWLPKRLRNVAPGDLEAAIERLVESGEIQRNTLPDRTEIYPAGHRAGKP